MPAARSLAAVVLLLAAACTRTQQRPRVTPQAAALGTTGQIEDLVRQALTLDAAGNRAADTLYHDALVVANGRVRLGAPRFAGVGFGGRITVSTATVTLQGRFAWALTDYRWFNLQQNQAEAGRATFICEVGSSGWKIVHAHSSQLLPWDR